MQYFLVQVFLLVLLSLVCFSSHPVDSPYHKADVVRPVGRCVVNELSPLGLDEEIGPGHVCSGVLQVPDQSRVVLRSLLLAPEAALDGRLDHVGKIQRPGNLAENFVLRTRNNSSSSRQKAINVVLSIIVHTKT